MPNLILLSRDADEYRALIEKANLPDLNFTSDYTKAAIILGEPKVIQEVVAAAIKGKMGPGDLCRRRAFVGSIPAT